MKTSRNRTNKNKSKVRGGRGERCAPPSRAHRTRRATAARGRNRDGRASAGVRARERERERLHRLLSTLDSVSKVVLTCTREDRVLEKCLTLLRNLVPFQNGAVFVTREDTGRLELEATLGYPQDLIERVQFDLGQGLSAWAAREKRAVLVKELSRPEKDGMPPLGSFLAVPIVAGGRSVGVITMGHPQPGAFVGDHKRTLQLFCTLISGSVLAMLLERRRAASAPSTVVTAA